MTIFFSKFRVIIGAISLGVVLLVGFGLWLIPAPAARGATLRLDPSDTTLKADSTMTVKLLISSPVKVNAIDATLTFDARTLQIVNPSASGGVFKVQILPAQSDNRAGSVRFVQANPQPFTGQDGLIGTMQVRALTDTDVHVGIGQAKITAADGHATDVYIARPPHHLGDWIWQRMVQHD